MAQKIKKQKETKHIVALEFVSFIVFCYFCSRNNLFKLETDKKYEAYQTLPHGTLRYRLIAYGMGRQW